MKHLVIVGGGLSGLASAYLLQEQARILQIPLKITLIERETRVGGKINSHQQDGYLCEWGPTGFLSNKPQTLQLCTSLGLDRELLVSSEHARRRFIYSGGRLHQLPQSQLEFLTNSLLSVKAKLRVISEYWQPQRLSDTDESLAQFTRRRLGSEVLDKLITPMASGIFAGDPETMSLAACFPKIHQLEQTYGGLIKGMLALNKEAKSNAAIGPGGVLTSFTLGMATLINTLAARLSAVTLMRGSEVTAIDYQGAHSWCIRGVNGDGSALELAADHIMLATPSYISSQLLTGSCPELANLLKQITYAPLAVVCLAYSLADIPADINGFGHLLAANEADTVLGTLWESRIFAKRAPAGKVLFRSMLGGARTPHVLHLTDKQLQESTQASLRQILGVKASPEMVSIFRHARAIPEYRLGHRQLVAAIMAKSAEYAGLTITGNAYFGVGINDCVARAYQTCSRFPMEMQFNLI